MSAVSGAEIARLGTQTVSDTPALAPSVTFSQNTGWGQLTIRGIGPSTLLAGSDPSSAMYLDGVYLARPTMAFTQFLDLERIEVPAGPARNLVRTQCGRGRDQPDSETANQCLPSRRRVHRRKLRSASRQRADQRPAQTRQGHGGGRVRAGRPERLRPRPRTSGQSAWWR